AGGRPPPPGGPGGAPPPPGWPGRPPGPVSPRARLWVAETRPGVAAVEAGENGARKGRDAPDVQELHRRPRLMFRFNEDIFIPMMVFSIPIIAIAGGIIAGIVKTLGRQRVPQLGARGRTAG